MKAGPSRPYRLGLTGSIGMGKSTTAAMFAAEGIPVWDADAAVHRIYAAGGLAVAPLSEAFPGALVEGGISRSALRSIIAADPSALSRIEQIVHPLVAADRTRFLDQAAVDGVDIVLLDIPLLFETGADGQMDGIVVVSAPLHLQRERVLARQGMTPAQLDLILSRQMPDAEKRARATWIIDTSTLPEANEQVRQVLARIRKDNADA